MTIPAIDLRLLSPAAADRTRRLDELRRTMGTIGVFYLVGHGIEAEAADAVLELCRRFFALPEVERVRDRDGKYAALSRLHRSW